MLGVGVGVILGRLMGLQMGWEENNFQGSTHMVGVVYAGWTKLCATVGGRVIVGCPGMPGLVNYGTRARWQYHRSQSNTEDR